MLKAEAELAAEEFAKREPPSDVAGQTSRVSAPIVLSDNGTLRRPDEYQQLLRKSRSDVDYWESAIPEHQANVASGIATPGVVDMARSRLEAAKQRRDLVRAEYAAQIHWYT